MLINYEVRFNSGDGRMTLDEGSVYAMDFAEAAVEIESMYPEGFDGIQMWIDEEDMPEPVTADELEAVMA